MCHEYYSCIEIGINQFSIGPLALLLFPIATASEAEGMQDERTAGEFILYYIIAWGIFKICRQKLETILEKKCKFCLISAKNMDILLKNSTR
jgi:hypothetical protein